MEVLKFSNRISVVQIFLAVALLACSFLSAETEFTRTQAFFNWKLPNKKPGPTGSWTTVDAFPKLPLDDPSDPSFAFEPIFLTGAPRRTDLFVCDKKGKVWRFANDPGVTEKFLFMDIHKRIKITPNASFGAIVFHPDFGLEGSPNRNYIYTHYFWSPDPNQLGPKNQAADWQDEQALSGYWRLSRFTVGQKDGQIMVDPDSEYILIQQYDAHHWHNGGSMFFDENGLLYLTSGDIGGDKNYYKAGQSLTEGLFGTVLRIDVDKDPTRSHPIRRQPLDHDYRKTKPASWTAKSYSQGYYIPNDNPWQNENGEILEEFWCIGIRSPHRMSYDPPTKQIWVGDVGQFKREEVNLIVKAGNYQWPYKDGTLWGFDSRPKNALGTEQPPAYEYAHTSKGAAVVGGYVYRGYEYAADLTGLYLFAEHQGGQIWTLDPKAGNSVKQLTTIWGSGFHNGPSSFGQDNNNELYVCVLKRNSKGQNVNGRIVKLARKAEKVNPQPPKLLSQTGIYSDFANRTHASYMMPYQPAAQFWSDGAVKTRHMMIPEKQKINFSALGNWEFPKGSIFVKHFDYPIDDTDSSKTKPIETRFFIHGWDGQYFGFSYRWNEDGTDAELLPGAEAETREIQVATNSEGDEFRKVNWEYPSRTQCMHCHTSAAGHVLGIRSHQLNCEFTYPGSETGENQLVKLSSYDLLSEPLSEELASTLLQAHDIADLDAPLEARVRSYLDTNCSQCHQPGGVYAGFDARYTTPLDQQGLVGKSPVRNYGVDGQALIKPRQTDKSILLRRVHSLGEEKMPPIAKNIIDEEATRNLAEWIHSLSANDNEAPNEGPPAAISDSVTVAEGGELEIDILVNDFDQDDDLDKATVEINSPATQGSATFDADKMKILYQHTGTKNDSFTYRIKDAKGNISNSARVSISIE